MRLSIFIITIFISLSSFAQEAIHTDITISIPIKDIAIIKKHTNACYPERDACSFDLPCCGYSECVERDFQNPGPGDYFCEPDPY